MLSEDWMQFRTLVTPKWVGARVQASHVAMAIDLLHDVLVEVLGVASIIKLGQVAPSAAFFCQLCSKVTHIVQTQRTWQRKTAYRVLSVARAILTKCCVGPGVVRAMHLLPNDTQANRVLGRKYGNLPREHPVRQRLEKWVQDLRDATANVSALSLRTILTFFLRTAAPAIGVRLDEGKEELLVPVDECTLRKVCAGGNARRKLRWFKLFVTEILRLPWDVDRDVSRRVVRRAGKECDEDDDGHDKHRISKPDLEKLYAVAQHNVCDELCFLLLLTTGMRIGGYVKMKCAHVADASTGKWVAREEGKTLEKGRRMFAFRLHPRVRELLGEWLNKMRPFDPSEYVFPGRNGGHSSTQSMRSRFKSMCQRAGLNGTQFHPHALRHCYSHILLELGNTAETVAKLINHASVATTEKHYLRESASEVTARAIIPWMRTCDRSDPVPSFLAPPKRKKSDAIAEQLRILAQ